MRILWRNLYFYIMLTQKQIQEIVGTIVARYQPEKIVLFGSYAGGKPNKDSDLDFCIIKKTKSKFQNRSTEVRNIFDPYPWAMDIFVFTPEEFDKRKNIYGTLEYIVNTQGQVLYGE
ncbi:MAG: nucleotidyltransferase domain-containing protein [Chitinophagales bacterium]